MLKYDSAETLFSIHMPKSGGSSLGAVLKDWYSEKFRANYENQQSGSTPFYPEINSSFGYVLHGHFDNRSTSTLFNMYPRASQFIAMLREPLQHHISVFNYLYKKVEKNRFVYHGCPLNKVFYVNAQTNEVCFTNDVEEFVEKGRSIFQQFFPFQFTRTNFQDVIDSKFVYLGLFEDYENSISLLATKLDMPFCKPKIPHLNVSDKEYHPSVSAANRFRSNNALEIAVYNSVLENHLKLIG